MIAILNKSGPPDAEGARRALAAAPHRGPCTSVRVVGNCVLGVAHHEDSPDAAISAAGPLVAAVTGRLDNAVQVAAAAAATGHQPASSAQADVVVAAFRAFGADAPNRMRGCFAGVVTDGTSLWCFRDHAGFRPLFYHDDARRFTVASEARQVVVGAEIPEQPDFEVLLGILYGQMPSNHPSALKGVSRLPQSTTLSVGDGRGVVIAPYWHPERFLETSRLSATDLHDRFVELMTQAVDRTLTGKDAVLLSGGVDSPAVAAFASRGYRERFGRPLGAVSFVFPDLPNVDEREFIEIGAGHFGMDLHTHRPGARALDQAEAWGRLFGTPIPTVSIPELWESYQLAHSLGYRSLLTGDFAEFLFGSPMHLVSHLLTRGRWLGLARLLATERQRGVHWKWLIRHLLISFVPGRVANWYMHLRGQDAPERVPDWLDRERKFQDPFRGDLLPPPWQRWRRLQLLGTYGSTITLDAGEICSARSRVGVRRPLADVDLWEFFLSLPGEVKCPNIRYKTLAREWLRGYVPDAILDRKRKVVFDDHVMTHIDYPELTRLLVNPRHQVPGVDYRRLAQRIERREFNRFDWYWAKDLARIHAFLNAW